MEAGFSSGTGLSEGGFSDAAQALAAALNRRRVTSASVVVLDHQRGELVERLQMGRREDAPEGLQLGSNRMSRPGSAEIEHAAAGQRIEQPVVGGSIGCCRPKLGKQILPLRGSRRAQKMHDRQGDPSRSQILAALLCVVLEAGDVDDVVDRLVGGAERQKEISQRGDFLRAAVAERRANAREGPERDAGFQPVRYANMLLDDRHPGIGQVMQQR